jgi:pyrroloquinoline quinone biosynthesis protein B
MRFRVLGHTLALGAGGGGPQPWLLLNPADPQGLPPRRADGTQAVLLTDVQIEQVAGLIQLRRGGPIDLYATPAVFEELQTALPALQRECRLHWRLLAVAGDSRSAQFQVRGQETLAFTAHGAEPAEGLSGRHIALEVRERGNRRRALFVRGLGAVALSALGALEGLHCLLVDPGNTEHSAALALWMATLPVPRRVLLGHTGPLPPGVEAARTGQEIVV